MKHSPKLTAIVGSYRKGGVIDRVVEEVLASAREHGADADKICLLDKRIEFCTNCRHCTQLEGRQRGQCVIADEMGSLLDTIEHSDALVLASPMNFGTVTALMKRFIERLTPFAYWPWGMAAPKMRLEQKTKRAVIVASSAAPAFLARLSSSMVGLLKKAALTVGARPIGVMFVGLAARQAQQPLSDRTRKKARLLGERLALSP